MKLLVSSIFNLAVFIVFGVPLFFLEAGTINRSHNWLEHFFVGRYHDLIVLFVAALIAIPFGAFFARLDRKFFIWGPIIAGIIVLGWADGFSWSWSDADTHCLIFVLLAYFAAYFSIKSISAQNSETSNVSLLQGRSGTE